MSEAILIPAVSAIPHGVRGPQERLQPRGFDSQMQTTLVPPISYKGTAIEAHGKTVPKDEVGGDLVDLVSDARSVIAYVADVSGHGLRAGVLMGMAKAAMRYGLLLRQPLTRLLADISSVLGTMKEPNMYLTLAALRFDGGKEVEYISAGHVPLLHYQQRNGLVIRHSMSQFPLGLFAAADYESQRIPFQPGDIFALVTDGIVEVGQDRDADSGLKRVAKILQSSSQHYLCEISGAIFSEVKHHGAGHDDQTILLVRPAEEDEGNDRKECTPKRPEAEIDNPQIRQATWRRLLDELTAELTGE
jgi:phosphoserine phosphatase RsbU/P